MVGKRIVEISLNRWLWIIAMVICSYLMWDIVIAYSGFERDVDFLLTKTDVIHLDYYRLAFYMHISSSLILMICGGFLFIEFKFDNWWIWHRRLGKTYIILLLFLAAPSGLIMGLHANGGFLAQVNFVLLSVVWWVFTFIGYKKAVSRNIAAHKKWMIRSFALILSAITLRVLQMMLPLEWFVDQQARYIIISWMSWTMNLIIAEFYIYYDTYRSKRKTLVSQMLS